jgi:predicted ester cyclase
MATEYKTLAHRWFDEVWSKGRAEVIDDLFADDGVARGLTDVAGNDLRGPAEFKPFFHSSRAALPDLQVTVEDTVAEGDKLAARCTVRATHAGEGIGLAATSLPVAFTEACILRVKDGSIVEAWKNFDFMSMFQQVGAIKAMPPSEAGGAV